jgi:hypothetical protein
MYGLASTPNIGTIRETFFYNQLNAAGVEVLLASTGDFLVDRQYTIEVGGASKTFKQIRNLKNSYLAVDNTLIGDVNKIPLWLFGLLY